MAPEQEANLLRPPGEPYFEVYLQGIHDASLTLFELTNFLYDLNTGYEVARLSTDEKYRKFNLATMFTIALVGP
jgi:hypothetical protein